MCGDLVIFDHIFSPLSQFFSITDSLLCRDQKTSGGSFLQIFCKFLSNLTKYRVVASKENPGSASVKP